MNKGWLELESDPGLFTLLLQDFGVKGVQVEEIYDLQKPIEGPAYGFIFLFRWIEERRSRRKTITEEETFLQDEHIVNSIFFAQQMIPNSCATHALLSVLLNCEKVNLGETLAKLKIYSRNMNPENKGYAIGNIPELAKAHNSHARKEPAHLPEKQPGMTVRRMEAFHFVSYVPINGRLFELDGLKPFPIDHGPWEKNEDWTEKFRRVISERLGMATGGEPYHDIRFNLMAVVPDKRQLYEHKLSTLKTNRQIVLEALQQMVKVTSPAVTPTDKEKCLEAVQKRRVTDTSTDNGTADKKSVINVNQESAKSNSLIDVEMSEAESVPSTNVNKISIKIEPVVKMEVDESKLEENVKLEKGLNVESDIKIETAVKTEMDSGHVVQNIAKLEVTDKRTDTTSDIENKTAVQSETAETGTTKIDKESNIEIIDSDTVCESKVQIQVSVSTGTEGTSRTVPTTVAQTDVTKPLTIQTKFTPNLSPGPSSESTDTASEVGSCFSSPNSSTLGTSAQNSPNVSGGEKAPTEEGGSPQVTSKTEGDVTPAKKSKTKFSSQQGFKPKDLLALLKNVENEIKICENNLRDEQEKMNKYKIDDCRRTHNYDQFLCTFLSMLAEQGHLAELVQQHSYIKKRVPGTVSKVTKVTKLATTNKQKKKTKPKKRR